MGTKFIYRTRIGIFRKRIRVLYACVCEIEREKEKGLCVLRLEILPQRETKNERVVTNCRVSDAFAEN